MLCMDTMFPLNGLVTSSTGNRPNDKIFWRITERNGDKVRLTPLKRAFTVKGNLIAGEVDPHEKSITRKITSVYGGELLGPVIIGGAVLGLAPWRPTKRNMGRGGKRIGAGRKKGSGKGPSVGGKTIYLSPTEWAQIKDLCGSIGVSEFIRQAVFAPAKKVEKEFDE